MLFFLLVTIATTNNTLTIIDKILLGFFMLFLLTPWDISHLIALATLFDLL
jgi:flagellar biosynthesis protein FliQ